jgi:hypothetical protein
MIKMPPTSAGEPSFFEYYLVITLASQDRLLHSGRLGAFKHKHTSREPCGS